MPLSVALYDFTDGSRGLVTAWVPELPELDAMSQTLSKMMEKQPILLSPGHAFGLLRDLFKAHPIFITQKNFRKPMTPMSVDVGPADWMRVEPETAAPDEPPSPDTRFGITSEGRRALDEEHPTDRPPSDDGPE